MLTEGDRNAQPLGRFVAEIPLAPDVTQRWFGWMLNVTSYQIGEPVRQGDRMVVPVRVTAPDLPRFERTIEAVVGTDGEPLPVARRSLKDGDYPRLTYDDDIVMVKEHHRWRMLVDFPAREQAAAMRHGALELYYQHDNDRAIATYEKAIATLDKAVGTGGRGLEFLYGRELAELRSLKTEAGAAAAYLPMLKLSGIGMKMSASHHPAVFGKITNTGSRLVDKVRMKVTFFQGHGKKRREVFSEEHTPVAMPVQFTDFTVRTLPLMPGETRDIGFELEAPVTAEEEADPYVAVSEIVFTPEQLMPASAGAPPSPAPTAPAGAKALGR